MRCVYYVWYVLINSNLLPLSDRSYNFQKWFYVFDPKVGNLFLFVWHYISYLLVWVDRKVITFWYMIVDCAKIYVLGMINPSLGMYVFIAVSHKPINLENQDLHRQPVSCVLHSSKVGEIMEFRGLTAQTVHTCCCSV